MKEHHTLFNIVTDACQFVFIVLERDGTFKLQIDENRNCVIHKTNEDIVAMVDELLVSGKKAANTEDCTGLRETEKNLELKNRKQKIIAKKGGDNIKSDSNGRGNIAASDSGGGGNMASDSGGGGNTASDSGGGGNTTSNSGGGSGGCGGNTASD